MNRLPVHRGRRGLLPLAALLALALLPATGITGQPQNAVAAPRAALAPSFTQPLPGMTVTAGTRYLVIWHGGTSNDRTLNLLQGDANALQVVHVISTTVDGPSGQYQWDVPANLAPGKYALGLGQTPTIAYTGLFDVAAAAQPTTAGRHGTPPHTTTEAPPAEPRPRPVLP